MAKKFQARIGRQVLRSSLRPSLAGSTLDTRKALAGLVDSINAIVEHIEGVTPDALEFATLPILQRANKYVPRDTEALADSQYQETVTRRGNVVTEIGYAQGGKPDYAVWVHEIATYDHEPPTRYKYLQAAMQEKLGEVRPRLIKYLQDDLGF